MSARDHYQVLGVARTASAEEVRAAYAQLLRRHHPDTDGDLPARLHPLQDAYRVLADPAARARHDRAIAEDERRHAERQRSIRRRLYRYDRRHPPRPTLRQRLGGWWRAPAWLRLAWRRLLRRPG